MKVIGLTGGIGSGKSTVSRLLEERGAAIVDADAITHLLEKRGQRVWREIWQNFGWSVLTCDGDLDRKKLGFGVFSNPARRLDLNRIVHPRVREEISRQIEIRRQEGCPVTILDVPLLIEGGLYRMVDRVWVVYADRENQIERIVGRDGVSRETALRRMAAQMPLDEKLSFADDVVRNQGGEDELREVVENLWQKVVSDA